jgi:TrmH family RNA methyltransferase
MTSGGERVTGAGAPRVVTSLQNERVKFIRSLDMRKVRKETGLFVAEGAAILVTARDNGFVPQTLVYQAGTAEGGIHRGLVTWALNSGAEVLEVSAPVLGKLASKDNPQTMLATFAQRWAEPPKPRNDEPGEVWLALEEIRDPGNLGTILRTVDAVGAKGVIMIGPSCDPYSGEAIRATMGSVFAVPLVKMERLAFVDLVKQWPGDVVGTHLDGRDDFRAVAYKSPTLIVMGSEGPGLSSELASRCTRLVKIPMAGRLDSLNLAVATALTLYQVRGPYLKL